MSRLKASDADPDDALAGPWATGGFGGVSGLTGARRLDFIRTRSSATSPKAPPTDSSTGNNRTGCSP
jgi:hypothetical protein